MSATITCDDALMSASQHCKHCHYTTPINELLTYGGRCEDCYNDILLKIKAGTDLHPRDPGVLNRNGPIEPYCPRIYAHPSFK